MLFDVTDPVTQRTQGLFYLLIHFLRSLPSNGFEIGEVKKREKIFYQVLDSTEYEAASNR